MFSIRLCVLSLCAALCLGSACTYASQGYLRECAEKIIECSTDLCYRENLCDGDACQRNYIGFLSACENDLYYRVQVEDIEQWDCREEADPATGILLDSSASSLPHARTAALAAVGAVVVTFVL